MIMEISQNKNLTNSIKYKFTSGMVNSSKQRTDIYKKK